MKRCITTVLMVGVISGCGGNGQARDPEALPREQEASRVPAGQGLQRELGRVLASEGRERGEVACDVLRSTALVEVFGPEAEAATFEPSAMRHALCTASWSRPNHEELEALRIDYEMRRAVAIVRGEEFNEPAPLPPGYDVSLTIVSYRYESAQHAVSDLEGMVRVLGPEDAGRGSGLPVLIEGWVEGVGDRAAWAPRISELLVADAGVRYNVTVRGFGGGERNKEPATRFARRLTRGM